MAEGSFAFEFAHLPQRSRFKKWDERGKERRAGITSVGDGCSAAAGGYARVRVLHETVMRDVNAG
jgi:hypothetical protein